jgi:hypothetical protein
LQVFNRILALEDGKGASIPTCYHFLPGGLATGARTGSSRPAEYWQRVPRPYIGQVDACPPARSAIRKKQPAMRPTFAKLGKHAAVHDPIFRWMYPKSGSVRSREVTLSRGGMSIP